LEANSEIERKPASGTDNRVKLQQLWHSRNILVLCQQGITHQCGNQALQTPPSVIANISDTF
jgi:hypothetical protein